MTRSNPPFGARFSLNETWSTIGWAKSSDDGGYIWCYEHEAEFVIGNNINYGSGLVH